MKPPIVFAQLMHAHEGVLRALAREASPNVASFSYLMSSPSRAFFEERGGDVVDLDRVVDDATILAARAGGRARAKIVRELLAREPLMIPSRVPGLDDAVAHEILTARLEEWIAHSEVMLRAFDLTAERYEPQAVIVSADWSRLQRLMIDWGKRRGIPTFHITHGANLGSHYTIYRETSADYVLLVGERGGDSYRDLGLDPRRLIVVGNLRLEGYASATARRAEARSLLRARFGVDEATPVALFATTGAPSLSALAEFSIGYHTLEAFLAACAQLRARGSNILPIVKGRPVVPGGAFSANEAASVIAAAAQYGFGPATYVQDAAIEPLVAAADVVVSADSNVSWEAAIAGVVPINIWSAQSWLLGVYFSCADAIPEIDYTDTRGLADLMASFIVDPALAQRVIADIVQRASTVFYEPEGGAAERAARVIAAIAARAEPREHHSLEPLVHVRHDVLHVLPGRADSVVWFEPSGATGRMFARSHPGAVMLIESQTPASDPQAALRGALGGDARDPDLIVAIDTLARARDPLALLTALRSALAVDGALVLTVPNRRNLSVIDAMCAGTFAALDGGLPDGRLRLFTQSEIEAMLAAAGFVIEELVHLDDPRASHIRFPHKGHFDIVTDRVNVQAASPAEQRELTALEFVIVARVAASQTA